MGASQRECVKENDAMKNALLLSLILVVAASLMAGAAETNKANLTWTDPNQAAAEDADFSIQGEYGVDKKNQPWAVQVVALGDGQFDAYLLAGGLPGRGWDRNKERIKLSGKRQGDIVSLVSGDAAVKARITEGRIMVRRGDAQIADLSRVVRKSRTLGAKSRRKAVVLFDGTSADAWINGRVENGLLPNSDVTTKQKFGSYRLHLEFRTPYKPYARGQGRGNSGVYHQGRYETQVLDSFGLEGRMNECGGIYTIAESRINMCLPPLTWQTYDVNFTAARFDTAGTLTAPAKMTVRLNGVVIHKDQELPQTTTAAPVGTITPEPGPIHIQHHGNPVYYRNIWIVPK
jgi:3-keto-disaccharide hydrolase